MWMSGPEPDARRFCPLCTELALMRRRQDADKFSEALAGFHREKQGLIGENEAIRKNLDRWIKYAAHLEQERDSLRLAYETTFGNELAGQERKDQAEVDEGPDKRMSLMADFLQDTFPQQLASYIDWLEKRA